MPEAGVGQGLQHTHHRGGNAGAADKTHDAIAGTCFFTIETNDEAGHDPNAIGGDPIDGVFQRTAGVLVLAGQGEAGLIRGFDAQKHRLKAGFGHHLHHFVVGGQIDGGFGGEGEGEAALHLPILDGRQQQLGVALVADEVVIHQEDGPAPAQVIEGLQFGHQLVGGFGAGLAPVEHDDVAELALERAAARELHAHRVVGIELEQVKAGDRRAGDIGLLAVGAEAPLALAPFDRLNEQGQGDFALIEDLEIG